MGQLEKNLVHMGINTAYLIQLLIDNRYDFSNETINMILDVVVNQDDGDIRQVLKPLLEHDNREIPLLLLKKSYETFGRDYLLSNQLVYLNGSDIQFQQRMIDVLLKQAELDSKDRWGKTKEYYFLSLETTNQMILVELLFHNNWKIVEDAKFPINLPTLIRPVSQLLVDQDIPPEEKEGILRTLLCNCIDRDGGLLSWCHQIRFGHLLQVCLIGLKIN
ncbi:hypothetical protein DFA_09352 [Cavenderia fasciculata]|uniref:Uncharacterized protein n=1 Tax=Cavenderia fasciculata TaxID=261658 RepID=F4Q7E0_CACFS|nr:uncharacterized protein DFA_09352 [Cavenderia fasciculata]EGG16322.1 hypothetical protein DFA_09352 [Cavenderia fasciculata]|eukprot:XP_004354706.1 hypothetical protein DFA_09352 [Cavenderia fasciculata]